MKKLAVVRSKKAIEQSVVNGELSPATEKRSNFDLVAGGTCPHDLERLGEEVRGRGEGVTLVCSKCGHQWYINRKIKTCKCLTCSSRKRSTDERSARTVEPDAGKDYNRCSAGSAETGADESRWASRTSNPLGGADNAFGGFDSHTLPPDFLADS